MAQNWQSDTYKQAVASRGGRWDNGGATATQNTWGTEAVDPSQWQSGGWYTNPNSGYVERWWADGDGGNGGGNGGSNGGGNGGGSGTGLASIASSLIGGGNNGNQGVGTADVSLPERPKINLQEKYNTLYTDLGLQSYKDKVNQIQEQIIALRDQTDQSAALINENPWSSAANRTGRLAKLEQAYNQKASVLSQQAALEQQKYADAMNELNTQMSLYTQQYNYDLNNFESNLAQINTLLDMGVLDYASQDSLQRMAEQTGMSAGMIQSMIAAQKRKNLNPALIQNTDDYGNVTVTLIDANTGNVLNQQSLGTIDASRYTPSSLSGGRSGGGGGSSSSSVYGSYLYNPSTGKEVSQSDYDMLYLTDLAEDVQEQNKNWAMQYRSDVDANTYNYIWADQAMNLYRQSNLSWKKFLEFIQRYMKPSDYAELKATYEGD